MFVECWQNSMLCGPKYSVNIQVCNLGVDIRGSPLASGYQNFIGPVKCQFCGNIQLHKDVYLPFSMFFYYPFFYQFI